jgi:hypothetical protein
VVLSRRSPDPPHLRRPGSRPTGGSVPNVMTLWPNFDSPSGTSAVSPTDRSRSLLLVRVSSRPRDVPRSAKKNKALRKILRADDGWRGSARYRQRYEPPPYHGRADAARARSTRSCLTSRRRSSALVTHDSPALLRAGRHAGFAMVPAARDSCASTSQTHHHAPHREHGEVVMLPTGPSSSTATCAECSSAATARIQHERSSDEELGRPHAPLS